jgi:hypothetical protein
LPLDPRRYVPPALYVGSVAAGGKDKSVVDGSDFTDGTTAARQHNAFSLVGLQRSCTVHLAEVAVAICRIEDV